VRVVATIALAVALTAVASALGSSGASAPRTVDVKVRDYRIGAPRTLPAGDVVLDVRNEGPDDHELLVVRGEKRLPLRADGITVDEDEIEPRTLVSLEPVAPGSTHTLRLHLAPGRYQLFCNMAGHYLGGMHTSIVVR